MYNIDLVNFSFENNSALDKGGCIFIKYFNYIMTNCKFINSSLDDKSSSNYNSKGAAIYSTDSRWLIINSIFTSNIAISNNNHVFGGAVSFQNTNISIKNSIFNRNSVIASLLDYSKGGAFYLSHSNCSLENTIFLNNSGYGNNKRLIAINGGAISSINFHFRGRCYIMHL